MYSTEYTQINSFNIIITTNNNAISLTQNNKERYVICEIVWRFNRATWTKCHGKKVHQSVLRPWYRF